MIACKVARGVSRSIRTIRCVVFTISHIIPLTHFKFAPAKMDINFSIVIVASVVFFAFYQQDLL